MVFCFRKEKAGHANHGSASISREEIGSLGDWLLLAIFLASLFLRVRPDLMQAIDISFDGEIFHMMRCVNRPLTRLSSFAIRCHSGLTHLVAGFGPSSNAYVSQGTIVKLRHENLVPVERRYQRSQRIGARSTCSARTAVPSQAHLLARSPAPTHRE